VLKTGGQIEDAELTVGDRLLLSRSLQDVLRLTTLGLEQWPWQVRDAKHLATGDGAVLLGRPTDGADISTISFPLSPTQLLVIGPDPAYLLQADREAPWNGPSIVAGVLQVSTRRPAERTLSFGYGQPACRPSSPAAELGRVHPTRRLWPEHSFSLDTKSHTSRTSPLSDYFNVRQMRRYRPSA
jgi:hypothetical protein